MDRNRRSHNKRKSESKGDITTREFTNDGSEYPNLFPQKKTFSKLINGDYTFIRSNQLFSEEQIWKMQFRILFDIYCPFTESMNHILPL